ncbi:CoA transferase [Bradyrhizobium sp. BR13661]|jgi:crotonobetainyl-CoA:carnitine CoA-transferase CaiB-like acyl-CoA transferase|uniref:CaiB/BaiF CoA transferase family protein n=1 Tax=Bradyrhizobium sp. BR13661 TaxID=2940622 RepID=UPI002473D3FC|nr:CoA transferase [Bradyrhizobium sp. BR13661]MDH6260456.1 crotonobetainyl-CoA:carnitine CoA-transferase CaiB-like acyl-CoA transferase [Bradyrhizobium sp. BR13661]
MTAQDLPLQNLPLKGIRVIDYSHFLAGPFMGRCLAAMGAEVIKVERPKQGDAGRAHGYFKDGQSGYFLQQNMGKQGLCIDLRDKRGLDMMMKLIDTADVFIENYRPGALERLGLGYKALSARNPKLIYCSVSAYGHTGPYADRPGFGLIAEAMSGALAQLGNPGEAPPLLRMPLADMYTGIHGVAAINAALVGRASSGRGQHIDLALYDCMVSMHDYAVQRYFLSGGIDLPKQTGSGQPDSTVYGVFPAKDGNLVIAAQVDDAWRRLASLIGGDTLASDERFTTPAARNAHYAEAMEIVRKWTLSQPSRDACLAALDEAGVPSAPVQTIAEVVKDPQIHARGMLVEQEHPVLGKVTLPNLPFHFSDCDTTVRTPAPLLGQDNRRIAASLGFSAEQVDEMVHDGVLFSEAAV